MTVRDRLGDWGDRRCSSWTPPAARRTVRAELPPRARHTIVVPTPAKRPGRRVARSGRRSFAAGVVAMSLAAIMGAKHAAKAIKLKAKAADARARVRCGSPTCCRARRVGGELSWNDAVRNKDLPSSPQRERTVAPREASTDAARVRICPRHHHEVTGRDDARDARPSRRAASSRRLPARTARAAAAASTGRAGSRRSTRRSRSPRRRTGASSSPTSAASSDALFLFSDTAPVRWRRLTESRFFTVGSP